MRLDCDATQQRSSLRLIVQNNAVFIMSFDEHRPWNLIEGHGRMVTKGNMINEECYCGRRVFDVKGNGKEQDTTRKKDRTTIRCINRCQERT